MEILSNYLWWQKGIIYQIYPRSFQDSNQDGIGDLKGIFNRLDYLQWLGVNAIWISPIYPSPMKDFGYDISDYTDIHPMFGTMADFDNLLNEAHQRNLKVIMDLVPNHTSDQHPWFLESRSSRDNPKRNWYMWYDPLPNGDPPNNWLGVFGGTAWEWDEKTGQNYYHSFLKEQPDLNWRNREVREAIYGIMRYWFDKGVDGFRIDVLWYLIKDEQLRNNPTNPNYTPNMPDCDQLLPVYSTDQPEVHEILQEMRAVADTYHERLLIGEIFLPVHRLVTYYGPSNNGANLPFNFMLISLPWQAREIASSIDQYESALPGQAWPNWVLGNHDQVRIVSRVGFRQAKVAAMMLLTLRGTPTIYYGDEIGMVDVPIPMDQIKDPQGLNMPGKNLSRDPCRTPMQWDSSEYAGFTNIKPWLPLERRYARQNVAVQRKDPYSMLSLYKKLMDLRKNEPSLSIGKFIPLSSDNQLITYLREAEGYPRFLVLLNLTHRPGYFTSNTPMSGKIEIATAPELEGVVVTSPINIGGDEGILIRLD
jgi:alpha-glucosidase